MDVQTRGAGARLVMLVVALGLVLSACGLGDSATKARTESVRGAAWPGSDVEQVSLEDGGQIVRVITPTPSPAPSESPVPFFGVFQPPGGSDAAPTLGPVAPRTPGRIFWPVMPGPAEPSDPVFDELGDTPSPEPSADPCDGVGALPDECTGDPCDDIDGACEPPDCDEAGACEPPACGGAPTPDPTTGADGGATPTPTAGSTEPPDEPCESDAAS